MKKIAVLGAGLYNIGVYKELKTGGFYTIAIDGNPKAPCFEFADESVVLNFSDKKQLLEYLSQNKVDAILPINDWGTVSAAYVSEKLGLVGINEASAILATDKGRMRDCWRENGLPNPKYFVFENEDELFAQIDKVGFPCVVKPTDSGGSGRGISVLKSKDDLDWAFEFAKPYARNGRFICEGFVEGTELTIETISKEGQVYVLAMSDKEKPELRTRVATSLNYPANLTEKQREIVEETVKKAVLALGIVVGMAHTEVIIKDENVYMVETGARGGGGHIYHTIIKAVSGKNAPVVCAQILTGSNPDLTSIQSNGAVYRFFNPPHGILKEVKGVEEAKMLNGVLDIGIIKKSGDEVGNLKNSLERAGFVVTSGKNRQEAVKLANQVESKIEFIIEHI
ncbi:MAG: ATP-grasp domain-containing protein [Bacteroidetes bacterium]|nr:ATP-grasp domain-containing protein [Bacteroidota bacterium]